MKKLIVGLGNPDLKYQNSRHNIGFMAIDEMAKKWAISLQPEKKFAAAVFYDAGKEVILAKPQVFMNESGISVTRLLNFYKVEPENLWLIHDDVDLTLGKLKIVKNRGTAGHRGVLSIVEKLGSVDFVRFRLGIGHPHSGRRQEGGKRVAKLDTDQEMTSFVLGEFQPMERDEVRHLLKKTCQSIELAVREGIEAAMNRYN